MAPETRVHGSGDQPREAAALAGGKAARAQSESEQLFHSRCVGDMRFIDFFFFFFFSVSILSGLLMTALSSPELLLLRPVLGNKPAPQTSRWVCSPGSPHSSQTPPCQVKRTTSPLLKTSGQDEACQRPPRKLAQIRAGQVELLSGRHSASLVVHLVKNWPQRRRPLVGCLGREDS